MLKKGDKVMCIKSEVCGYGHECVSQGRKYEISLVGLNNFRVNGGYTWFYQSNFKPIERKDMEPTEQEKQDAYMVLSKASGIKVGDKVKVLRSFKEGEMGACAEWRSRKGDRIGTLGIVSEVHGDGDISLAFEGHTVIYPWFVLEIVEPAVEITATFTVKTKDGNKDITREMSKGSMRKVIDKMNE